MAKNRGEISPVHERAWRDCLRVNALLMRELDADLRKAHNISLVTYDALVQLSEAPDHRLYMKDLADALVYSASGLTRLVDNLEKAGLARREADPNNRRATLVVLTEDGMTCLKAAYPTHRAGVATRFAAHVSPAQANALAAVYAAMRTSLEAEH